MDELTHLHLDKMAAILQTIFSDGFLWMKSFVCILMKISLKFVPKGPIDNYLVLVEIMAWSHSDNGFKPLSALMLIQFIDAYMRH